MSTYVANPAGLGVGKRYGPLNVGGVGGEMGTYGSQREMVFEITAGETASGSFTLPLPAHYLVEKVYLEVEVAFAASSTANLAIGGGAGLTTPLPLSTAIALNDRALTGLANLSSVTASSIVLTVNANGIASTTGKARVVVTFKAV